MDGPFRSNATSCVNHSGTAATACPKCGGPYCAQCMPMTVNGQPWCELCTNELSEGIKPRIAMGLLAGGGVFLALTLLWLAKVVFLSTHGSNAPLPLFYGYPIAFYAGMRASRSTTSDPPIIELRRR